MTVLDLVSGFLREALDLEGGLWPTLRDLTLRPGHMLQRYLRGAHRSYMHPGRYLLMAIVLSTVVMQATGWMGVTTTQSLADVVSQAGSEEQGQSSAADTASTSSMAYQLGYLLGRAAATTATDAQPLDAPASPDTTNANAQAAPSPEAAGAVSEAASSDTRASSQTYLTSFFLLLGDQRVALLLSVALALFLGLTYRRMFPARLSRAAPAIALGLFIAAHVILLETAIRLPITVVQYVQTGQPVEGGFLLGSSLLILALSGWTAGACFGRGWQRLTTWRAVAKGSIAALIAQSDAMGFFLLLLLAYSAARSILDPGGLSPSHPLFVLLGGIAVLGAGLFFLPHIGLLVYRRVRPG